MESKFIKASIINDLIGIFIPLILFFSVQDVYMQIICIPILFVSLISVLLKIFKRNMSQDAFVWKNNTVVISYIILFLLVTISLLIDVIIFQHLSYILFGVFIASLLIPQIIVFFKESK